MQAAEPTPGLGPVGRRLSLAGLAGLGLGASGLAIVLWAPAAGVRAYGSPAAAGRGGANSPSCSGGSPPPTEAFQGLLASIYLVAGAMLATAGAEAMPLLVAVLFAASGALRVAWALAWPRFRALGIAAGLGVFAFGLVLLLAAPGPGLKLLGVAIALDLAGYGDHRPAARPRPQAADGPTAFDTCRLPGQRPAMTLESLRAETEARANLATALLAQSLDEHRALAADLERLSGEVERRQQAIDAPQTGLTHAQAELAGAQAEIERLGGHIHAMVNLEQLEADRAPRWGDAPDLAPMSGAASTSPSSSSTGTGPP